MTKSLNGTTYTLCIKLVILGSLLFGLGWFAAKDQTTKQNAATLNLKEIGKSAPLIDAARRYRIGARAVTRYNPPHR